MTSKKYLAASVPRFLRQTRLGYLPLNCLIGSRNQMGDNGANLIFDIVMLSAKEFHLMRLNVGMQHIPAPALKADAGFNPAYMPADTKEIIVPDDEPDPEGFARNYFLIEFGLITPPPPAPPPPAPPPPAPFRDVARECAMRKLQLAHSA